MMCDDLRREVGSDGVKEYVECLEAENVGILQPKPECPKRP